MKRGYFQFLILLTFVLILLHGCAPQEVETLTIVPKEIVEEATKISEESPPIEVEANNLTDVTTQKQNGTV